MAPNETAMTMDFSNLSYLITSISVAVFAMLKIWHFIVLSIFVVNAVDFMHCLLFHAWLLFLIRTYMLHHSKYMLHQTRIKHQTGYILHANWNV